MTRAYSFLLAIIFPIIFASFSMAQTGTITGMIKSEDGSVEMATVKTGTGLGTYTDANGEFILTDVPYGNYEITILQYGYEPYTMVIELQSTQLELGTLQLKTIQEIGEVEAAGKSKNQQVKEQAFHVNAIELKSLQNLNMNVNQVLNTTTGVRIRESGGLGSDFEFSLSGFTGNQVRFFIDGVPMDYMGNAFTLNVVPVNILDRIEVYKGVVPVHLGSDVLGGAVNIVTNQQAKNFLDVSYGVGSFNTHQAAIVGKYTLKNNFTVNLNGFYNYSDNNYKVAAFLYDKETGKVDSEPTDVERFHDGFQSSTGSIEFGFVKKKFADRILIGFIGSQSYKEVQQGANMNKVAGHVTSEDYTLIPTFKYSKRNALVKGLDVSLSAIYSHRKAMTVDTSSRVYDWSGSYTTKTADVMSGELNWYKTLFTFNDDAALATATLTYALNRKHRFTINNTYSWLQRVGTDSLSSSKVPFSTPNSLAKNFLGASYKIALFDDRWQSTVFGKYLTMKTVLYRDADNEYEDNYRDEETQGYFGYGLATTYYVLKSLQLKASYEHAYRMPEGQEIFGNGLLLHPNFDLISEESDNFNVSALFGKRIKRHHFQSEFGYLFRIPQNMIRLVAMGVTSQYENLLSSQISGYELTLKYGFDDYLHFEVNATYQDMINMNQFANGANDPLYLDRIPNIPYLFGNASLTLGTKAMGKLKHRVSFNWNTLYVEEFFLKWPSQGAKNSKYVIPRQFVHSAALTYSLKDGMFNLSLSCNNILDDKLYDNFKVQKPGRSFHLKLRYFITHK